MKQLFGVKYSTHKNSASLIIELLQAQCVFLKIINLTYLGNTMTMDKWNNIQLLSLERKGSLRHTGSGYMKTLGITHYQRSANQNHNEVSSHTSEASY
jgi:hypothetical protein